MNAYLFFHDGYISVSPTVISMGYALSDYYDNVIIFAKHTPYKNFQFKKNNIKVVYCDEYIPVGKNINKLKHFVSACFNYFKKTQFPKKRDLILNVDDVTFPFSLILATLFRAKYTYLSLEIPVETISSWKNFLFKFVRSVLIQDELRFSSLLASYQCSPKGKKVYYIPNSIGWDFNYESNSMNLLEQFNPADLMGKTVCAQLGMIEKQVYSDVLAKVFESINDSVLIYHDRIKIDYSFPIIQELLSINKKNLLFSELLYDIDELFLAYDPIDIGIACYKYVDDNFGLIGKASGKLACYLYFKKPVIVNELKGYSELVEKYQCGIVIHDINDYKEWENAIKTIMSDYAYYSQNAYWCYLKEFDFNKQILPFFKDNCY